MFTEQQTFCKNIYDQKDIKLNSLEWLLRLVGTGLGEIKE
jgi:hypothetical protein